MPPKKLQKRTSQTEIPRTSISVTPSKRSSTKNDFSSSGDDKEFDPNTGLAKVNCHLSSALEAAGARENQLFDFEIENVILRVDVRFDEHMALQVRRVSKQDESTLTTCSIPMI
jgi:hypothetical protein